MNAHLTEDMLIRHAFDLAEGQEGRDTAEHLGLCESCAAQLERLQAKFRALDLLSGDAVVSQELISQVVAEAEAPRPVRIIPFGKPAWMAAAAVLIVGVSLFVLAHLGGPKEPGERIAAGPEPGGVRHMVEPVNMKLAGGKLSADRQEKPPFAPASAIELVVLPRREKVQLTIYNSADLTLVRERRNLTMKKGWNWLQFMWADTLIDPTSLSLEPLNNKDKIDIRQLVYPARLKDIGRWLIRSEVDGQVPFEITYLTSGLHWRAFYMGTLSADEKMMQLSGYVRVDNNSGEDYENAQTRLIVGKVHLLEQIAQLARRRYPFNRPGAVSKERFDLSELSSARKVPLLGDTPIIGALFKSTSELARKDVKKEGLSEYFLYTIEGTETIPNGWSKRLGSFDAEDVPVSHLYKYDQERFGRGVVRFLSFANDADHELGETPIPGGLLKVYRNVDDERHLAYTGQSSFKYIPVDEDVELNLGAVSNVVVKPVLMDYRTANHRFNNHRDVAGWDEITKWKIEVRNTRDLDVEIEITRGFGTNYWKIETDEQSFSYEKYDASHGRFEMNLPPQTNRTIEYTLTKYHGTRREEINN